MKKIIPLVVALHLALLLLLKWQKKTIAKPKSLKLHALMESPKIETPQKIAPVQSIPIPKAALPPVKKASAPLKKPLIQNPPAQKTSKSKISKALAAQLQENIAKIHEKSDKVGPKAELSTPGSIHQLKIDMRSGGSEYEGELVGRLQKSLHLPEVGEVEVQLTLNSDGHFAQMEVIRSESSLNRAYLEQHLKLIHFPPFTGALIGEKTHLFTLTFCNR